MVGITKNDYVRQFSPTASLTNEIRYRIGCLYTAALQTELSIRALNPSSTLLLVDTTEPESADEEFNNLHGSTINTVIRARPTLTRIPGNKNLRESIDSDSGDFSADTNNVDAEARPTLTGIRRIRNIGDSVSNDISSSEANNFARPSVTQMNGKKNLRELNDIKIENFLNAIHDFAGKR